MPLINRALDLKAWKDLLNHFGRKLNLDCAAIFLFI